MQDFYGWSTLKEVFSVFINVFGFCTFKVFRFADVCTHRKVHEHLFGWKVFTSDSGIKLPKTSLVQKCSDSWRNLLFLNLAFKAQPVSMLFPFPSAFRLFLRLMYSKRKPVYKLCKEPWTLRWKCLFVFSLQAPINDNKACVSLMGIKSTTKKAHIVRAILESIAYR